MSDACPTCERVRAALAVLDVQPGDTAPLLVAVEWLERTMEGCLYERVDSP